MELIIRCLVVFVFLWVAFRVAGKRQVAQLDAFDLVTIIVLGGLVTQGILQEDYSATGAFTAVALITLLSVGISWVSWRFPRTRPLLEGTPTILVRDGEPDLEAMKAERVTMTQLLAAAREHGIRSLDDTDLVLIEADGAYSFFTRDDDKAGDEGAEEGGAKAF